MKRELLLIGVALGAVACGTSSSSRFAIAPAVAPISSSTTSSVPSSTSTAVTSSSTTILPATDARKALEAFVTVYWDPNGQDVWKNSDHQAHNGNLYSDFWWQAHFVELALDAWEATGDPNDLRLVAQLHDGFVAQHATWTNDFDDDLCWWALALAHAFEATGDTRYRDRAVTLFDSIAAFEDQTYGGGLWWKRNGTNACKNVCINCPFVMTALHLYAWTGDATYLDRAKRVYAWVQSRLTSGATVGDTIDGPGMGALKNWQITYNYGTYIGASLALADATGDPSYLAAADAAADQAIASLTTNGILKDEGDGDGAGFKMILTRYLARLAQRGRPQLAAFLATNAAAAWSNRRPDDLMGRNWGAPAPTTFIQSFAAASAVDVQFHAVLATLPPLAAPSRTAIAAFSDATVTADHATLTGLSLEAKYPGFSGAGYVAGWNQDGESVTFTLTAPRAGDYTIEVRYGAGAGDATRSIVVNGSTQLVPVLFPATPSWSDWCSTSFVVALQAGANKVGLAFDSVLLSSNYLNVDALTIAPQPGQ
ncbi:MAG TPA: glycoside hydrolase family 76 protein [Planctomycetota bacterium]|nr:glycoside hydrolase family 76 protein [Planctomycetota bacterium]